MGKKGQTGTSMSLHRAKKHVHRFAGDWFPINEPGVEAQMCGSCDEYRTRVKKRKVVRVNRTRIRRR